jgi:predicted small secreted protein
MNLRPIVTAVLASAVLAACSTNGSSLLPGSGADVQSAARAAAPKTYAFAPYVDMTAYPPFEFAQGAKATGTRYFTMAFLVSLHDKTCQGAWGGFALPSDPTFGPYVRKQLAAIRNIGGDGILSFGGAGHLELAQACPDAASLEKAYEADIDVYKITHVDFDIEGPAVDDRPSVDRRSQALFALVAHYAKLGKTISVSYTLPVLPRGMPDDVLNVMRSAVAAGVKIDIVNEMTMDFGDYYAPNPQGKMGTYAIESIESAAKQLKQIGFPLGANPYASLGATPMIGVNDNKDEIFEPADAQTLYAWANKKGIGRLSFWAAQRDKECKGGAKTFAVDTCSSIVQTPGRFSKIFSAY